MPPTRPRPLRFVIDTNIAISALLWGGQPRKLLALADDPAMLQLFSSPVLLGELQRVLDYPKFQPRLEATGSKAASLLFAFRSIVTLVEPADVPEIVARDPDDNHVMAAALAAQADAIVSGDDDLLALGDAAGVPVLRVGEEASRFCVPEISWKGSVRQRCVRYPQAVIPATLSFRLPRNDPTDDVGKGSVIFVAKHFFVNAKRCLRFGKPYFKLESVTNFAYCVFAVL